MNNEWTMETYQLILTRGELSLWGKKHFIKMVTNRILYKYERLTYPLPLHLWAKFHSKEKLFMSPYLNGSYLFNLILRKNNSASNTIRSPKISFWLNIPKSISTKIPHRYLKKWIKIYLGKGLVISGLERQFWGLFPKNPIASCSWFTW